MATSRRGTSIRLPMLLVGLTMIAFIAVKAGRDVLVVGRTGGVDRLPLAFGLGGLAALVAAALHVLAMSRFGVRRVRIAAYLLVGAVCVMAPIWAPGASAVIQVAFFALTPVAFAALFADAWLLVGEVPSDDEGGTQRHYVRVAAASTTGGVAGALTTKALGAVLSPAWVVAAGGFMLLAGGWLATRAPTASAHAVHRGHEGPRPVRVVVRLARRPFVLLLGTLAALGAVAGVLVDLQLYLAAAHHGKTDLQFFANVYFALAIAALAFQLTAANWVERRLGVAGVLAALPMGLSGLAGVALFSSTLTSRFALRAAEGGLKAAVHRAAWERTFAPIPAAVRPYVKTIVDGAAARIGESGAGLGLAALGLGLEAITWLTFATVAVWTGTTFVLHRFTTAVESDEGVVAHRLLEACPVASILGREQPP